MSERLGFHYTNRDGVSGKIYFDIVSKHPGKACGSICYVVRVRESMSGNIETARLIQEYKGFYNVRKEIFTLYPSRRLDISFLDYPFVKQVMSAYYFKEAYEHNEEELASQKQQLDNFNSLLESCDGRWSFFDLPDKSEEEANFQSLIESYGGR